MSGWKQQFLILPVQHSCAIVVWRGSLPLDFMILLLRLDLALTARGFTSSPLMRRSGLTTIGVDRASSAAAVGAC